MLSIVFCQTKIVKRVVIITYLILGIISFSHFSYAAEGSAAAKPPRRGANFLSKGWHPYIGVMYGYQNASMERSASTQLKLSNGFPVGASEDYDYKVNNRSSSGAVIVLGIGKIFREKVYFGVEAEGYFQSRTNFAPQQFDETYGGKFSIKPLFDLSFRIGMPLNDYLMPYLKLGVSCYDANISPYDAMRNVDIQFLKDTANFIRTNGTLAAPYIGGGVEYKIAKHLFLRGEYTYSLLENDVTSRYRYIDDRSYLSIYENSTVFNIHKLKVGVVYAF